MSWYVIEGPDDTGKTTLARGLERRGWTYQHCDSHDVLPTLALRMSQLGDLDSVVWDRAHLGERVHHPERWQEGWARLIEAFLLEKGTRAVLLLHRYNPPEEWENDIFTHQKLIGAFRQAAGRSALAWGQWPDPMPKNQLFGIDPEEINEAEASFTLDRLDPEGLGGFTNPMRRPEVWVLGERQNPHASVAWPFATRCGIELVWPAIGIYDVRVSNALPSEWRQKVANPYTDLHERWEGLGRPPVIALGRVTERACKQADVPVQVVLAHPQWHLRFKAKEPETYIYHLRVAILNTMRERLQLEEL